MVSQQWCFQVERRFGLNNRDMATLKELSRALQISSERIRQILVVVQEKLAGWLKENWLY